MKCINIQNVIGKNYFRQINKELVSNLDYAQTFLDYAGVEAPKDMQGKSLRPLFENTSVKWRDELYYPYWMHGAHFNVPAHLGIRTKTDKVLFFMGMIWVHITL